MASRSPLPGSRPGIPPSVLGQRGTAGARQQGALFRARQARRERFARAGAGFASPNNTISSTGTGLTSPIVSGDELLPSTIVFSVEFFGGYPGGGNLFNNGEFVFAGGSTGTVTILHLPSSLPISNFSYASTSTPGGGTAPTGVHVFATVFDPANDRIGVYLDGDLIVTADEVHAQWSTLGTWSYLSGIANIGWFSRLEVFPGYLPPTFF